MGADEPSSPVTTLPDCTLCYEVICWRENEAPGLRSGRVSLGAKNSSQEQGTDFGLVGTSRMVVIRETPRVVRMSC
jgi:hypothetical protein